MKKVLSTILLVSGLNIFANNLITISDTKDICKNSLYSIQKGKVNKAFNDVKKFWPLPPAEIDNVAYQTKVQLDMVSKRFGNAIGIDFIRTKEAGKSFLEHTYILKYENTSIRYICTFYKPSDKWLINSIRWDDKTSLLFE